jgi:chemotaxis signal transduction protein
MVADLSTYTVDGDLNVDRSQSRYILTQLGEFTFVIPSKWVKEIVRIDRSRILPLPMFDPLLVGVIHHHGHPLPLIDTYLMLQIPTTRANRHDKPTIVCFDRPAGNLAGLSAIVDRAIGSVSAEELSPTLLETGKEGNHILARTDLIDRDRWHPLNNC